MGLTFFITMLSFLLTASIITKNIDFSTLNENRINKINEQTIETEKSLLESIKRYKIIEGSNPTSMNDLNTKGYFPIANNKNGFGETYSFSIDSAKGTVAISTNINDSKLRSSFVNSNKNIFQVTETANVVTTNFNIPTTDIPDGGDFLMGVPIQATAPSASTYKYWYDTSGTQITLKVSDGTNWANALGSSGGGSGSSNTTSNNGASITSLGSIATLNNLQTTGTNGEIKYVYDSTNNSLSQYTYYNGIWKNSNNSLSAIGTYGFKSVAEGRCHACALTTDGTAYCWGNSNNKCTIGPTTSNTYGSPTKIDTTQKFSSLYAEEMSTCGISSIDGKIYCWGSDGYGSLGNYGSANTFIPTSVASTQTFIKGEQEYYNALALGTNGLLYSWGYNSNGQLGDGTTTSRNVPTLVRDSAGVSVRKYIDLARGDSSSCAIDINNIAYCWGNNSWGQLGTNNTTKYLYPTTVKNSTGLDNPLRFINIQMGGSHTCAIDLINDVYCWGTASNSALGNGISTGNFLYPVLINGGKKFTKLSLGLYTSCGIEKTTNNLYCWGSNGSGQYGNGSTTTSNVPVLSGNGLTFSDINLNQNTTCGITTDSKLYCWGDNTRGQIGDGTFTISLKPKLISY